MDLRLPIGSLFAIFGIILTVYGLVGPKDIYKQSLGINVNLDWGAVMLIFGLIFVGLAMAKRSSEHSPPA